MDNAADRQARTRWTKPDGNQVPAAGRLLASSEVMTKSDRRRFRSLKRNPLTKTLALRLTVSPPSCSSHGRC